MLRSNYHSFRISKHPSIRINAPDLDSFAPRVRFTQWHADWLSPRNITLCPGYSGAAPACTVNAHAVMTVPNNSKTLMDESSLDLTLVRKRARSSRLENNPPLLARL